MKYPLLGAFICFSLGVALSHWFLRPFLPWIGAISLVFIVTVLVYSIGHADSLRVPVSTHLCCWFSLLVAGGLIDCVHHSGKYSDIATWSDTEARMGVHLVGRVRSPVTIREYRAEFSFETRLVITGPDSLDVTGILQARMIRISPEEIVLLRSLHPGDILLLSGILLPLPELRNPFDFDRASTLRRSGIIGIIDCSPGNLQILSHRHDTFDNRIHSVRTFIGERINQSHNQPHTKQLLSALLIGNRELVEEDMRILFTGAGLAHLLAISGLHVGIIGMSIYWILGTWLVRIRFSYVLRQWLRTTVTIAVLICYTLLSGGSASVIRATLMAGLFMIGICTGRLSVGWNLLALSGLVLLLFHPDDLFRPGFQLSFSAVGGIFLYSDRFRSRTRVHRLDSEPILKRFVFRSFRSMAVTVYILAATFPVMLYHFGTSQPAGIISNLAAIPVTGLLILSGILSTAVGPVTLLPLSSLSSATDLLATALITIADWSETVLGVASITSAHERLSTLWFIPVFILFTIRFHGRMLGSFLIVFILLFHLCVSLLYSRTEFRAIFFDVGQGDAALFITPGGNTLLVDTGMGYSSANTITRHLSRMGVDVLDAIIITHSHRDHAGGLPFLLRQIDARKIISAISAGSHLPMDPSIRIHVLSPRFIHNETSSNNDSVVLRITYGDTSFLLLGDAGEKIERFLVPQYSPLLRADVVKVAHHGSGTSSLLPFVERVVESNRTISVVSVGALNRFGHPDPGVIKRWIRTGAEVVITSRSGAVVMESDGVVVKRLAWRTFSDP